MTFMMLIGLIYILTQKDGKWKDVHDEHKKGVVTYLLYVKWLYFDHCEVIR